MAERRTRIKGVGADAERTISGALVALEERLRRLERKEGRPGFVSVNTAAKVGEFLNIEAPAEGLSVILPEPTPALRNARITLAFRNSNPVKIVCILGQVNRESFVINATPGVFDAICNGLDGWEVAIGVSSSGLPTIADWADVLANGNTSGGSDPTLSATDTLRFVVGSPGINAAGDLTVVSATDMHLHAGANLHLGHVGDTVEVHIEADGAIESLTPGSISESAGTTWSAQGTSAVSLQSDGNGFAASPALALVGAGTSGVTVLDSSSVAVQTNGVARVTFEVDGSWNIGGSNGTTGQFLRSFGAAAAPQWATIAIADIPGIVAVTGAVGIAAGGGNSTFDGNRVNDTALANRSFMDFANGDSITVSADDGFAGAAGTTCRYTHSYTGTTAEIVNSTATSNLGTIDISTLVCGGTYRVSAASSAYSIEGFTAKPQGFWFTFISEDAVDSCTLFNEDATATATNRLALPGQRDAAAVQLRGIFIYNGSRWSFVSQNPSAIGTATNYVEVSTVGTPVINLVTSTGDINATAGGEMNISGDNCTLTSTSSNGITTVTPGFLQLPENSASGATVIAGRGMLWVRDTAPSCPMFTGDTNIDHTFLGFPGPETAIAVGTTNNFALADDAQVARRGAGAGASVLTGMAGGRDGRIVLISNIDGSAADTVTLNNDDAASTAANRFYCPAVANFVIRARGSVFVRYDAGVSRWMVLAP